MSSGEQGLSASKCAAWDYHVRNGMGGGSGVFGGGCPYRHEFGMVMVAEGLSVNMATSAVLVVCWMEWKTGPCATFDVDICYDSLDTWTLFFSFTHLLHSDSYLSCL